MTNPFDDPFKPRNYPPPPEGSLADWLAAWKAFFGLAAIALFMSFLLWALNLR